MTGPTQDHSAPRFDLIYFLKSGPKQVTKGEARRMAANVAKRLWEIDDILDVEDTRHAPVPPRPPL